jgi:hypothetical protein
MPNDAESQVDCAFPRELKSFGGVQLEDRLCNPSMTGLAISSR